MLFFIKIPWGTVALNTVAPHIQFTKPYFALLIGVLGTTISPYLFFWQSVNRVDDMRAEPTGGNRPVPLRRRAPKEAKLKVKRSRFDVFTGMGISNLIMFAIIVATAATLGRHGHQVNIGSPAQAASALKPVAGKFASYIFAFGFIGSGMLAIPVLAGSGSAGMAGLLGRPTGFSQSIRRAPVFYGLCLVGIGGGMALSLLSVNPIKLLVLVAIINGVAAAPFLIITMLISSDRSIMGDQANGRVASVLGWLTALLMAAAAASLFVI